MKKYLSTAIQATSDQRGTATVTAIGKPFNYEAKSGRHFRMVPITIEFQGNVYTEEKVFETSFQHELQGVEVGSQIEVSLTPNGKFCVYKAI